ncbi:MAG: alpha/beta hydrolase [Marmoricola sp.]|jgi:hypothetical protein|nr:alpha/beta hydrolase [Marmoricola sp.]
MIHEQLTFTSAGVAWHFRAATPCDHFDVWPGKEWFDSAVAHQVAFLTRKLAPSVTV